MSKAVMMKSNCQVCSEKQHKYKCPACELKYCSVPCYKKHKEECIPQSKQRPDDDKTLPEQQIDKEGLEDDVVGDRVTMTSLQLLDNSSELKEMLENPHLQHMLTSLDSSRNSAVSMATAMQIPIFTEFADKCLSVVEPQTVPSFLIQNQQSLDG